MNFITLLVDIGCPKNIPMFHKMFNLSTKESPIWIQHNKNKLTRIFFGTSDIDVKRVGGQMEGGG